MKKVLVAIVIMSFFLTPALTCADEETYPWQQKYHIKDNESGGECEEIGNWNRQTKTCMITKDFHKGIEIESDNITVDGNGHKISSDIVSKNYKILINEKTGVTLKNLNLEKVIVSVRYSDNITIENITV